MKSISMKEKYRFVELPKMISSLQDIDKAIQYVSALDDFSDNMLFQLQKRLTDENLEEILEDKFYSTYDNTIQKRRNDYIKEKIVSDKKIIDVQTFIQKTNISKKDIDSVVLYLKMNKEYSEYNSHLILKAISRRELKQYYRTLITQMRTDGTSVIKEQKQCKKEVLKPALSSKKSNQVNIKDKSHLKSSENSKVFYLNWEKQVTFLDGKYLICATYGKDKFVSQVFKDPMSLKSYNFIIEYIKQRLPKIRCQVVNGKLHILDDIQFRNAFLMIVEKDKTMNIEERMKKKVFSSQRKYVTFETSSSEKPEVILQALRKYKSKFLTYLSENQSLDYKIIPAEEVFAYKKIAFSEDAFIFTIKSNSSGILKLVFENVNSQRSTLIFVTDVHNYYETVRNVFLLMSSDMKNKREEIHNQSLDLSSIGVNSYYAINHSTFEGWNFHLLFCGL